MIADQVATQKPSIGVNIFITPDIPNLVHCFVTISLASGSDGPPSHCGFADGLRHLQGVAVLQ